MTDPASPLINAIHANNGAEVERLLAASGNARTLYRTTPQLKLNHLAEHNRFDVIRVIAHAFPEDLNKPDIYKKIPFLVAAKHQSTESLIALAQAGADIHVKSGNHPDPVKHKGAITHACMNPPDNVSRDRHIQVLRELGLDINAPEPNGVSPLTTSIINLSVEDALRYVRAGANLYKALSMRPPRDALHPKIDALSEGIDNLMMLHEQDTIHREDLLYYIESIVKSAPTQHLSASTFFNQGALRPEVLEWEGLDILPVYFQPAMADRWEGGIAEMLDTAQRLPAYIQGIDLAALRREMPSPREETVTAHYVRGQSPPPPQK